MTAAYQALYGRLHAVGTPQTARANLDEALGHLPPELDGGTQNWEAQ